MKDLIVVAATSVTTFAGQVQAMVPAVDVTSNATQSTASPALQLSLSGSKPSSIAVELMRLHRQDFLSLPMPINDTGDGLQQEPLFLAKCEICCNPWG